jgi:predicted HTH domain antitoxin
MIKDKKQAPLQPFRLLPQKQVFIMKTISIQLPETAFSALRKNPEEFVQEMRIAAAVKWYELAEISQGKAADIAGLTRSDFINALSRYQVSFLQYTAQELSEELANFD